MTRVRFEFVKSPEVTLCGWRGYKPSINKLLVWHHANNYFPTCLTRISEESTIWHAKSSLRPTDSPFDWRDLSVVPPSNVIGQAPLLFVVCIIIICVCLSIFNAFLYMTSSWVGTTGMTCGGMSWCWRPTSCVRRCGWTLRTLSSCSTPGALFSPLCPSQVSFVIIPQ